MNTNPEKPPIVAVTATRLRAEQMPNRKTRRTQFIHTGKLPVKGSKPVNILSSLQDASLLCVMPDGSGYLLSATLFANECSVLWQQENTPKAEPDPVPAATNA
ncbi:hypothetical protein [Arsenicibacter rosenii]|uniref:Uncharacterized protein n=1 Tax=Arsenicibacter rosenii TaxID=1750698 RepID=A0A1S2VNJ8_9BACT|nr:hypothetical protein [Arsenicibacter rosenii]OIN59785.1 hypothetical protein BLX24_07975 [Arsenicibacter rosenii]